MKNIFALLLIIAAGATLWLAMTTPSREIGSINTAENARIRSRVSAIKKFIADNQKYNSSVIFLADMKIYSGKNRFFVYDFNADSILDRGLVAHGSGSETGIYGKLQFSNVPNSLCTSVGKYSIGKSYLGQFGKAYKL